MMYPKYRALVRKSCFTLSSSPFFTMGILVGSAFHKDTEESPQKGEH